MKIIKLFVLTLMVSGLGIQKMSAQHELKTNVTALIFADLNLGYEYVQEDWGVQVAISYFQPGKLIDVDNLYTALRITPEFKYYFNPDEDASGTFVSGYLRFRSVTSEDWYTQSDINGNLVTYDMKNTGLALGFTLGYKWVTRSGLMFETFGGLGRYLINNYSFDPDGADESVLDDLESLPGFDWRLGFALGYRFGG